MTTPHKLVDGVQIPLTQEEIAQIQAEETAWNNGAFDRAMSDLRQRRDAMLKSCDWVMMSDSPIADKSNCIYCRCSISVTSNICIISSISALRIINITYKMFYKSCIRWIK